MRSLLTLSIMVVFATAFCFTALALEKPDVVYLSFDSEADMGKDISELSQELYGGETRY
ncbi:hypothetical protein ACFL6S_12925 [Candidatus Poribacteria bacterium]